MAQTVGFFTDTTLCIGCKACEVACKEWNQLPNNPLEFRDGTVIDRYFFKPWARFFQFRGQLVAEMQERAEIAGTDGRAVNSSRRLQGVRQRLVGGRYPNRAPLRDGESHKGNYGKHKDKERGHFCSTEVYEADSAWPMGQEYQANRTSGGVRQASVSGSFPAR